MVKNKRVKALALVGILSALYGLSITTSATGVPGIKPEIIEAKPQISRDSDWSDNVTIWTEENVNKHIIETTKLAKVENVQSALNVRSAPILGDKKYIVGKLAPNTVVKILNSENGWAQIEFIEAQAGVGYVSESFLGKVDKDTNPNTYGSIDIFE